MQGYSVWYMQGTASFRCRVQRLVHTEVQRCFEHQIDRNNAWRRQRSKRCSPKLWREPKTFAITLGTFSKWKPNIHWQVNRVNVKQICDISWRQQHKALTSSCGNCSSYRIRNAIHFSRKSEFLSSLANACMPTSCFIGIRMPASCFHVCLFPCCKQYFWYNLWLCWYLASFMLERVSVRSIT